MNRVKIKELQDRIQSARRQEIHGTRSQFDAVTLLSETEELVRIAERAQSALESIAQMKQEIERTELVNPTIALERVERILNA